MKNAPHQNVGACVTKVQSLAKLFGDEYPEFNHRLEVTFASPGEIIAAVDLTDYLYNTATENGLRALLDLEVFKTAAVVAAGAAVQWRTDAQTQKISADELWRLGKEQHNMQLHLIETAEQLEELKIRVTFRAPRCETATLDLEALSRREPGSHLAQLCKELRRRPDILNTARPVLFGGLLQWGEDGEGLQVAAETLFEFHEAQQKQAWIDNAATVKEKGHFLRVAFSRPEQEAITIGFSPFIKRLSALAPLRELSVFETVEVLDGGGALGWNSIGSLKVSAGMILALGRAQQSGLDAVLFNFLDKATFLGEGAAPFLAATTNIGPLDDIRFSPR